MEDQFMQIVNGYKEALFFAEHETSEEEFSEEMEAEVKEFCGKFYKENNFTGSMSMQDVGRLLYFTSHGHGAGFWEFPEYQQFDAWCEKETRCAKDRPYIEDGLFYPAH